MVIQAATQPDEVMLRHANDLDFPTSKLIAEDAFGAGASIWQTTIRSATGVGYWIGDMGDNGTVEIYAYLMLVPSALGDLAVLEAKKGWTQDIWRRKGLGSALLREAAKAAPLQSDTDGMTDMAFAQWRSIAGFKRRWWDAQEGGFVKEAKVPSQDMFTAWENGRRWALVLEL